MKPIHERYGAIRGAVDLRQLGDPVNACLTTVAGLLLLAIVCAGFVVAKPAGLLFLVLALLCATRVRRVTADHLLRSRTDQERRRLYLGLFSIAAVASIPFSLAFLQTDLQALAATATANAQWQGPGTDAKVLQSLYGSSPAWPSYGKCQVLQNTVGRDLANGCYSAVGYLRSWQIPSAIPLLLCLTGLYCGIPLFVARHLHHSPR